MDLRQQRLWGGALGVALVCAMLPQTVRAQQASGPTLILGTVASDPGTTATIPLYYQSKPGQSLRTAHLELEFVSNSVKFSKAQKGAASEVQDFELAVDAKELPPDDKNIRRTRLNIDVSVTAADSAKALPEGLWAFLDFSVPTDAKPFSISLNPLTISAHDNSEKPVALTAETGKIIVAVPDAPAPGCFFFTH